MQAVQENLWRVVHRPERRGETNIPSTMVSTTASAVTTTECVVRYNPPTPLHTAPSSIAKACTTGVDGLPVPSRSLRIRMPRFSATPTTGTSTV